MEDVKHEIAKKQQEIDDSIKGAEEHIKILEKLRKRLQMDKVFCDHKLDRTKFTFVKHIQIPFTFNTTHSKQNIHIYLYDFNYDGVNYLIVEEYSSGLNYFKNGVKVNKDQERPRWLIELACMFSAGREQGGHIFKIWFE